MVSIPSIQAQPQEQQKRVAFLEAEVRRLIPYEQQVKWEDRLFANPHIAPTHKLTLRENRYGKQKVSRQAGLTKVYIPALAENIGLSPKTTGKSLQFLAEAGAIERKVETETNETGQHITRVFIGLTNLLDHPELIKPPTPRNHGGSRQKCKDCGSENLIEEKTILCADCGCVQHKNRRFINGQEETPPPDNLTAFLKPKEPPDNLTNGIQKPTTPPTQEAEEKNHLQVISELLFDIAGDHTEHIMMSRGEKKYITISRPLTKTDILEHLQGIKTIGAKLSHADGTTRAICFDADTPETWNTLQEAAKLLLAEGYKPILELSPAGRGGHLWIIFSSRVNAKAAHTQVCKLAPELEGINEYWPRPGNQKVRLPAGRYISASVNQWTTLYDAAGAQISKNGSEGVEILLQYQTPAAIIPALAEPAPALPPQTNCYKQNVKLETQGIDSYWMQKYAGKNLWFGWTDEMLAEWYNSKTTVYDLLPPERNGNGLAQWRGERTASVAYRDKAVWVDFGATAQKENGKKDGGDSLELATRIEQKPKREVMRDISRQFLQEARAALENAAGAGEQPPQWLLPFITPDGWTRYEQIKSRKNTRGVVGFNPSMTVQPEQETPEPIEPEEPQIYTDLWTARQTHQKPSEPQTYLGTYPPPQRATLCCNSNQWIWNGESYQCGECHPLEE